MRYFIGIALLGAIACSCERNTGTIGLNHVNHNGFELGDHQSLPVVATSETFDSLHTSQPNFLMLGEYDDPIFGHAKASFVSQIILTGLSPDFGVNAIVDSAFLILPKAAVYGDSSAPLGFTVKRLGEVLSVDSSYLSSSSFTGVELLCDTVIEHPRNGTALVVRMDTGFFQSWVVDASQNTPGHFASNTDFVSYLPGLILEPKPGNQAMYSFNKTVQDIRVRLYYSNDSLRNDTVGKGVLPFDMLLWEIARSANVFELDHSNASFNLGSQDSVNGEHTVYLQAMGGSAIRLNMVGLDSLRGKGLLVNHASLRIPVREGSALIYSAPNSILGLVPRGNSRPLLRDYYNANPGGALMVQSVLRDRYYTLEITRHVQRLLSNTDSASPEILIVPASMAGSAHRAVINGNLDPVAPITLELYTAKPF
ncbi:MAG: DUF4270 family protein [Schleiferiaceae bacterium]|nr:DUF4270 family protein [Schleiferiaceae bacterium]